MVFGKFVRWLGGGKKSLKLMRGKYKERLGMQ